MRVVAGLVLAGLSAGAATTPTAPSIEIAPAEAQMDEAVSIRLTGLAPKQMVTLRASACARDRRWWRSQATFASDERGQVDLAKQAPVRGSYGGVDAMGLFWSMAPDTQPKQGTRSYFTAGEVSDPVWTHFELEVEGRKVAERELRRWYLRPGLREVRDVGVGLVARFYEPAGGGRHVGVIVLGGSEGGFSATDAALLAARGYAALALAYFGTEGLPRELHNIPLEYFKKAIDWMQSRDSIDPDKLAVIGDSRGAELALLLGATFPEIKAVIARAPSHVVWEGADTRKFPNGASWTYQRKPLPYVPYKITPAFAAHFLFHRLTQTPVVLAPMFVRSLQNQDAVKRATIPVERINGPVLLISGADDQIWPSSWMAERVMQRLRSHGHGHSSQHLSCPGAGHPIPSAYKPMAGSRSGAGDAVGGTPEATARAQSDSWPKILAVLEHLRAERR